MEPPNLENLQKNFKNSIGNFQVLRNFQKFYGVFRKLVQQLENNKILLC